MPRVSSDPRDAFHFKGTFEEGWGEVMGAGAVVFQYPPDKATGRQGPPQLMLSLQIQRLIDAGGAAAPSPEEEVLLNIQGANRQTSELDLCHPGMVDKPDDEPTDAGEKLGTMGNTLYAVKEGFALNDKVKYMRFTASLVEKGFKPDVLKRTYFPDLIGLRAYFMNLTVPKFRDDQTGDPTVFVVKEIKQFPYERAATAQRTTRTRATKATTAAAAPAKGAAPTAPKQESGNEIEDAAADVLTQLAVDQKGALLPSYTKLKVLAFLKLGKLSSTYPKEMHRDIQKQLEDHEWVESVGAAQGLYTFLDDGKVQFE